MSVLFITGAGISANAGIPTYRDAGSSWRDKELEKKSHATRYGTHLDELWDKHWGPLSEGMKNAEPTLAHKAIAAFQQKHPSIIATQNIDDLHERAGSDNVAHLHGVMKIKCFRCRQTDLDVAWSGNGAPVCPNCGKNKTRPDVVLFGETLNKKLFRGIDNFGKRDASHIIAVGTSLNVFPAAGLMFDVLGSSKTTVLINKEPVSMQRWIKVVHNEDADLVIEKVLDDVDKQLDT